MSDTHATGRTRDAGWQIGVSTTLHATPAEVWSVLTGDGLAHWLDEIDGGLPTAPGTVGRTRSGGWFEIRSYRPLDRIRLRWSPTGDETDVSTLQVAVRSVTPQRTMLRFHQELLPDAAARERQRTHWESVRDEVSALVNGAR